MGMSGKTELLGRCRGLTGDREEGCKEAGYTRLKTLEVVFSDGRPVQRKDGNSVEKREIGVFDDTMEVTLTLWGSMTASADSWDVSKTGKDCRHWLL